MGRMAPGDRPAALLGGLWGCAVGPSVRAPAHGALVIACRPDEAEVRKTQQQADAPLDTGRVTGSAGCDRVVEGLEAVVAGRIVVIWPNGLSDTPIGHAELGIEFGRLLE